MIKYQEIITIKQTNALLDLVFLCIISASMFLTFNTQVSAWVSDQLNATPSANFVYPKYTNQNQASIEITDKKNVEKVFFNGIESRDKVNVQLQEGQNTFVFTLAGKGEDVDYDVAITKDTILPTFDTSFEFKDTKTKDSILYFDGILSEEGTVFVNDKQCVHEGKIICEYEIFEKTDITVTIADLAGNEVIKEFTVDIDKTSPDLKVSVENPTIQSKVLITISSSEILNTVKVNGVSANQKDSKTFTIEVNLQKGHNIFEVVGVDLAGNETKQELDVERKDPPPTNNGGNTTPINNGGGNSGSGNTNPEVSACSTVSLQLYNVKTPVFSGESQSATVKLTCSDGKGYSGQSVNVTVRYANGTTQSYNATTNSSGIANFSFVVPSISGSATMTARFSLDQTSVTFQVN